MTVIKPGDFVPSLNCYTEHVRVFVNDVEEKYVTEINTEAGYIVRAQLADDGKFIHDGIEMLTMQVWGKIRLERK